MSGIVCVECVVSGIIYFCDLLYIHFKGEAALSRPRLCLWHLQVLVVVVSIRLWCIATRLSSTHRYTVFLCAASYSGTIVLLISWECFESVSDVSEGAKQPRAIPVPSRASRGIDHSTNDGYHWVHPSATYIKYVRRTYQSLPHLQDIVSVRAAAGSN